MGKGDKRTRKGKIFRGSHGKSRPRKRKKQKDSSHLRYLNSRGDILDKEKVFNRDYIWFVMRQDIFEILRNFK